MSCEDGQGVVLGFGACSQRNEKEEETAKVAELSVPEALRHFSSFQDLSLLPYIHPLSNGVRVVELRVWGN